MTRARDEWKLALAGIAAGILTLVIVVGVWFLTRGSTPQNGGAATTTARAKSDRAADPDAGPIIGKFQSDINRQLRETQPSTRPLSAPLRLVVRDIAWRERNGRTFARAAGANGTLNVPALARGDVILAGVQLDRPEIYLREAAPGNWNFQQVFYDLLHAPETPGPKRRIHLEGFRVANGYVDVKRPADAFSFRNVEGRIASLSLSDPGLSEPRMTLSSVDGVFERMASRTRLPIHAEDANLTFPDGTVVFSVARANIENTRLAAMTGIWNPEWPGYGLEAQGDAVAFDVSDFASFAPDRMPAGGSATFHFAVHPLAGDGTDVALTNVAFKASEAGAQGDIAFQLYPTRYQLGDVNLNVETLRLSLVERIMGRKLPYTGTISGTLRGPARDVKLDLTARLAAITPTDTIPFATHVTGSIAMLQDGLTIRQLVANLDDVPLAALRAFAPSLPLTGSVTGTIAVDGSPATTPVHLDMRLEVGSGLASVNGVVDLTGTIPRYDVTGRIVGIDMQMLMKPAVPPVTVAANFAFAGAGFAPAEMNARLRVDGGFTGWRANVDDTLVASVRIFGGAAYVDTLVGSLATARVNAAGQWRFVEPASGAVHYQLAVSSLEPFGPYLPVIGDSVAAGSIDASGDVSGDLAHVLLAGTVKADEARSGSWSASSFDAKYAITLGAAVPEVQLDATGRGIGTPTAGTYEIATAHVRMTPPSFRLDFNAQRSQAAGAIEVSANGRIPTTGARELYLERAFFDLAEGRWQMARPARIAWGGADGVRVDSLELHNAATGGEVRLDGRVLPMERADFTARVAALPVGDVQELIGREPIVTGSLWADARIQPPGDAPHIDATFRLQDGVVQGVPFSRLEGTLAYADQKAVAKLTAAVDTMGIIDVDATVPVAIRLTAVNRVQVLDEGPLDGHVTATNFSLAPVDSFVTMVRGVAGYLNGSVQLAGTARDPSLNGDLSVSDGSVIVPQLNQTFSEIGGTLHFSGRRAELQNVSIRSDGTAQLAGDITFEKLNRPVLDVTTTLNGFRPLGVDNQTDAAVDGTIKINGAIDAIDVTGNVAVRDGYFVVPQFGADITTAYGDLTAAAPVLGQDLTPAPTSEIMKNLTVSDFVVRFGDGVWVAAQEAKVQLSGALTINKAQDELHVLGELEGQRGTYTLSAGPIVRRFDITHANVRFQGSTEMNPAIDIDARRIVLDPGAKRLNVDVHIGGTMRTPTLSLASADAPNIPQAELLSFLLFGRSTLAVGTDPLGSGGLLQETALTLGGGAVEALSQELEQRLLTELRLPLDVFQVNLGLDGNTSVVLGRQLSDKLFVSFESGLTSLGGLSGSSGNATTGGTSDWALRFEWAFAPQSFLQFGIEPVRRGGRIQGLGSLLGQSRQQKFVGLRRRWTW
jgi:autotransporter translocation and assembly factor TamB